MCQLAPVVQSARALAGAFPSTLQAHHLRVSRVVQSVVSRCCHIINDYTTQTHNFNIFTTPWGKRCNGRKRRRRGATTDATQPPFPHQPFGKDTRDTRATGRDPTPNATAPRVFGGTMAAARYPRQTNTQRPEKRITFATPHHASEAPNGAQEVGVQELTQTTTITSPARPRAVTMKERTRDDKKRGRGRSRHSRERVSVRRVIRNLFPGHKDAPCPAP